jgi:hypothetical protein
VESGDFKQFKYSKICKCKKIRGAGCEALLVSLERTPLSLFPAAQRQLWQQGNPPLSNLAVCCVILRNAMNWLGIPIENLVWNL